MEFAYDKLKGRIKEKVDTQQEFAKRMGLGTTTITNKLNNDSFFTNEEIFKACEILDISFEELRSYFFTLKVR